MQRPKYAREDEVALPAQAYPHLMETLRKEGTITVQDKGGRNCVLVLDKHGLPHREDMPHQYVKLTCSNLLGLMHTMEVMIENGTKKDDKGKTLTLSDMFHLATTQSQR